MKQDTKYEIGYKIRKWVLNMRLNTKYEIRTKYEIGYKIRNWIQNMKFYTKYEILYEI